MAGPTCGSVESRRAETPRVLPGGIGAGFADARDAALRWVAKRRDLLVPSLVADRSADPFEVPPEAVSAASDVVERPEIEGMAEVSP